MDDSITQTQVSSSSNIFKPVETLCLSIGPRRRTLITTNDADFAIEMEDLNKPTTPIPLNQYGYLKHIQTYKPLCKSNDKSLPRKVR